MRKGAQQGATPQNTGPEPRAFRLAVLGAPARRRSGLQTKPTRADLWHETQPTNSFSEPGTRNRPEIFTSTRSQPKAGHQQLTPPQKKNGHQRPADDQEDWPLAPKGPQNKLGFGRVLFLRHPHFLDFGVPVFLLVVLLKPQTQGGTNAKKIGTGPHLTLPGVSMTLQKWGRDPFIVGNDPVC